MDLKEEDGPATTEAADPDTATSHIMWCPEVVEKTKSVNQLKKKLKKERIIFSRQQLQSLRICSARQQVLQCQK